MLLENVCKVHWISLRANWIQFFTSYSQFKNNKTLLAWNRRSCVRSCPVRVWSNFVTSSLRVSWQTGPFNQEVPENCSLFRRWNRNLFRQVCVKNKWFHRFHLSKKKPKKKKSNHSTPRNRIKNTLKHIKLRLLLQIWIGWRGWGLIRWLIPPLGLVLYMISDVTCQLHPALNLFS